MQGELVEDDRGQPPSVAWLIDNLRHEAEHGQCSKEERQIDSRARSPHGSIDAERLVTSTNQKGSKQ
jgi:hypothetical protein